ncbi:MAG: UDP-4-amino-4,6-dideoxy-N-acetyl-beta-L-altrosamine transaminase [Desulfobacterales bacterium]|jgi:perosamine synthetase
MIPYGRQTIDENDIQAVVNVLRSDWLTTGPKVDEFENAFADFIGAKHAVAVSSGTAALHSSMFALNIGSGDEVIVPPLTFAATANCIVYQGGTPVFTDVCPDTLLLDPEKIEEKITPRTKAIIAVDYTGHPCDYDELRAIANKHGLKIIADSCHALGGEYKGTKVGLLADITVFSFHPVKHITTAEGGMLTTSSIKIKNRANLFRNHGINSNFRDREKKDTWQYEMVDLGYNYRITDLQCALGVSQLLKLANFLKRRREIAARYDHFFSHQARIKPLSVHENVRHAYHLYVIRMDFDAFGTTQTEIFRSLRQKGIGVNVHYMPVHLHPFYRDKYGTGPGMCPVAEANYGQLLSLPLYPEMKNNEVDFVIEAFLSTINGQ